MATFIRLHLHINKRVKKAEKERELMKIFRVYLSATCHQTELQSKKRTLNPKTNHQSHRLLTRTTPINNNKEHTEELYLSYGTNYSSNREGIRCHR